MEKRYYTIENLEELLDNLPYEIWLKNEEGKYIYINKLGLDKLGLNKSDVIGKTDHELRPKYIADKCLETDINLIYRKLGIVSQEEKNINSNHVYYEEKNIDSNNIYYNINKFILNGSKDIILGGIADEVTLNRRIQDTTEYIMSNNFNLRNVKSDYIKFLKEQLESLNKVLGSINIDIFIYKKDSVFKFYISSNNKKCIFDNNSEIIFENDFKKELLDSIDYFDTSKYKKFINLNSNYYNGLISKLYDIEIANKTYTLINVQYKNEKSIKYKDEISIRAILKKISILIFQLENNISILDRENRYIEDGIDFEHIKSNFIANISHEFKTPINIILSIVQLLISVENGKFNNMTKLKYIEYINILKQNSYRLLRLVNNIIDTAKIENNFYKLNLGNYNIIKVVEDIVMSTSSYISENNRNIIFDTDEEEVFLACDPEKIERVILNLISNAVKFSYNKSTINIDISTDLIENRVYISVKNKGEAIKEEDVEKIFGQFMQSNRLFIRNAEGSGIGLYLSKYFIKMHNGDIWLNLNNRDFTEFIFYIPIEKVYIEDEFKKDNYIINENKIIEACNIEFSDIYE